MELQAQQLLSYSDVFPDRQDKIEDLLASIPSNSAVEFLSNSLAQKVNQFIGGHDVSIWAPWVLNTRDDVKNRIGLYAQQFNLGQYALIDKYAMLLLISRLLTNYNGRNDELTEDDFTNLLLAYLLCCNERLRLTKSLPYNTMTADEFVENYMPDSLKINGIESPRDYRLLLIKCYTLLVEFPKNSEKFARYVDEFCKEKGISDAKTYLDELFLTFLKISSEDVSNCLIEVDEDSHVICHFLDNMSIDPHKYKHHEDFLMMRGCPILKTGPHRYNIMYMKMFLDKAYTGLLFDMKDALVNRGLLDADRGYENLRSFLGGDFSERFFFYSLMDRCFGQHYVKIKGELLEKTLGKGLPDYYMRRGNHVFVFECKDAQVASKTKLSGDYEKVKRAVFEKYASNAEGRSKGIGQLAKVIEEKLLIILSDMDKTAPSGIKYVFPVIIYFDDCFDVEGPSYLLNKEFRKLLSNDSVHKDFIVKDLVLVNVEQLMRLENFFSDDKLKLANIINDYIDYKNRAELNQVFPFNKFLFQEARKKGYKMERTRWFDEVYQSLKTMDKQRL